MSAESEPLSAHMHSKSDLMQYGLTEPTIEDLIMCTCTIYTSELCVVAFQATEIACVRKP